MAPRPSPELGSTLCETLKLFKLEFLTVPLDMFEIMFLSARFAERSGASRETRDN